MLRVNNEKYDVIHENFDGYFEQRATKLTEQQKSLLPRKLMVKLYKKGGRISNALNTSKLNFLEKVYILFKMFKSRWYIVVEDENGGSLEDWENLRKAVKKREVSENNNNRVVNEGHFFLANKETCDAFSYINEICTSPAYGYLVGAKNNTGIAKWKREVYYITSFISNYESIKKMFLINTGLKLPEWYVLVYIYDKKNVLTVGIYKEVYKQAFSASPTQIKTALGTLQDKKMIVKQGYTKGATINITEYGKDVVNKILSKYIINK